MHKYVTMRISCEGQSYIFTLAFSTLEKNSMLFKLFKDHIDGPNDQFREEFK